MSEAARSIARVTITVFAAIAVLAAPLGAQQRLLRASDVDTLPAKPADARIAYGPDSLQFGDLRLPPGDGPFPVAIVIHGGCWVSRFASVRNSTPLADALRDAGIATWNVEYRRTDSPGGGWPATFTDVALAAEHLRVLARSHPLDLTRVVAVGHSAGGHLALWLAGAARVRASSDIARADPLPLRAAIALAGIGDLEDFRTYSRSSCGDVIDPLMGGTPEQVPERYAAGSPVRLLPFTTPQVQIVGSEDRVLPQRARDLWLETTRARGGSAELIVLPGLGHHEPMSPRTAAWPVIRDAVLRALGSASR